MSLVTIENEHGLAVVSPRAGAALRRLLVKIGGAGHDLLSGEPPIESTAGTLPDGTGSFIMAPWVNRIHEGRFVTGRGEFSLPVNSGIHAIHGTVRGREWEVVSHDQSSAMFRTQLEAPWPFRGEVVYGVKLTGPSLEQTLSVVAAPGEDQFPAGVGWHPWFRRSLGSSEVQVQGDVEAQWELDENIVPTGQVTETDASKKLFAGGRFEVREVDGCFKLKPGGGATLRWPEVTLRMSSSEEVTHVMVYSPERSVCVEPQTTAVNAFQLADRGIEGTGTRHVSPGNPLSASTTWSWTSA